MHAFKCAVETSPFQIPRSVAGKESHDSRIAVVVPAVFKHPQLQKTVGHFLFAPTSSPAVEELDFHSGAFQPIPELPHLRRYRTYGQSPFYRPIRMRQSEKVGKVDPDPVPGLRAFRLFLGQALCFMENV